MEMAFRSFLIVTTVLSTIESVSRGAMTLGSAERFMLSVDEAEELIGRLHEAVAEASDYECELVEKECNVNG